MKEAKRSGGIRCPGCDSPVEGSFYGVDAMPVHSVLLMSTRKEALSYPKGDIRLARCSYCGLVTNAVFEPTRHEYSSRYEETQQYSPTFNTFHRVLADDLIEKHDLRGKHVLEIGCGKGEFLRLLCELGGNRGTGFDPAFVPERFSSPAGERIHIIDDFYSDKYAHIEADFICCKMTLEHIWESGVFLSTLRRAIRGTAATVFFQVPNLEYVLRQRAFWDIYYEHCAYFSAVALKTLFSLKGFQVLDVWTGFDDQYLMIDARPSEAVSGPLLEESDLLPLRCLIDSFSPAVKKRIGKWRGYLSHQFRQGRRVIIWGAGSKAVAFLNTLGIVDEIQYGVDVNPYKQGTYLSGTGQEIVAPGFLGGYRPDVVIVMNPIYLDEIQEMLLGMELHPEVLAATADPIEGLAG
jgi:SAM-dependent methyltransferase